MIGISKPLGFSMEEIIKAYLHKDSAIYGFSQKIIAEYFKHRKTILRSIYIYLVVSLLISPTKSKALKKKKKKTDSNEKDTNNINNNNNNTNNKPEINKVFFRRLWYILKIIFPSIWCSSTGFLIANSIVLVLRTYISLYIAELDGKIVGHMIKGRGKSFLLSVFWWMTIALPATYTNSILTYLQCKLALTYRKNLTLFIQDKYLSDKTCSMYYSIHNLDDRIKNADQVIASDVQKFTTALATIYSNLAKPILDITVYTIMLSHAVGGEGMIVIGTLIQASSKMLRILTPPFGKYVAEEARLEGEFRYTHSRLLNYSEEIALLNGEEVERDNLDRGYFALIKHINRIIRRHLYHGVLEDFVIKYIWGALGLILCSFPVFFKLPGVTGDSLSERSGNFTTNRRLLVSSSDAFGRLMSSFKEISELAGYTSRVSELLEVMDSIQKGNYMKVLVSSSQDNTNQQNILSQKGKVTQQGEDIIFKNVPIVSPNGDILVQKLSFTLKKGHHLLIIGPNGCGKSSLFRILGGLWPIHGGEVIKPPSEDIFYIPQRPYLPIGSLRQQVIYPDTVEDMQARGITDNDLYEMLAVVHIENLVDDYKNKSGNNNNENINKDFKESTGWNKEEDWREVLSGGVQQRLAMARLFYHRPKFAILDECTSSVSLEIERDMYTHAKNLGISLLTVSHRLSLWKYHDRILQFLGNGKYVFSVLDVERRLSLEEEKQKYSQLVRSIPKLQARLEELEALA